MNDRGPIAFIPPRFGDGVVGGAEAVIAEFAEGFAERGWEVEVLTTCAQDHYTWANHFPAGSFESRPGLTVRRFPTVLDTPGKLRDRIGSRILGGDSVSLAEQFRWMNDSLRVPELWDYVLMNADRYQAIVVAPYMFWTTFAVGQIAPERTIVMPCLHDEPQAALEIFRPLIAGARGIWFLSEPEAELADRLFQVPRRFEVVGAGIEVPGAYDPDGFRSRYGITGPMVFYAGRREWGKGWLDLVEAFEIARRQAPRGLTLVTSGVGDPNLAAGSGEGIVDLGFVTDAERNDAMAAADAYVQPSSLESFSRTVLEAWLAGTAVIANSASDVVRWHVARSGAGVTYEGTAELVEALALVSRYPESYSRLAAPGRDYVLANYRMDAVLDRAEEVLQDWTASVSVAR